jgi:polyisoprenoid-binding protein YceI
MDVTSATSPTSVAIQPGRWLIDPAHSQATFAVRYAGLTTVRGTIDIVDSALDVEEDFLMSSVTARLDPSSVHTGVQARDAHLRSADFFDVARQANMSFTSSKISAHSDHFVVTGVLTIRGVSREVALTTRFNGAVLDPFGSQRAGFTSHTSVTRSSFNMNFNMPMPAGGWLLSDTVDIDLEISLVRAS